MWALLREDGSEFLLLQEDRFKEILRGYSEQDIVGVELKHTWNKSIEELEKVVLENADFLLSYPFFQKIITKGNFSNIKDYIKQEIERIKKSRKQGETTISRVETKKPDGTPVVYESKPIPNEKIIELELFIKLWIYYNLIQEKIKKEIKRTPKIKNIDKLPANSIFTNLQNLNKEIIKESKTKVVFKVEGLKTSQVAIMLSLYYAILYCISEGINQEDSRTFSFNLDNLMEIIGLPKRRWGDKGRGYSNEQKEEVLWLLGNVIGQPLRGEIRSINEEGREIIKKLLGTDVSNNDILFFNPFAVFYSILYDGERGYIKNANIKVVLHPLFSPYEIYSFKTNIFKSKLDDPHYRIFAIWLANGKRLGEKTKTTPEEVFSIAEIDIDYKHPDRMKEKFKKLLDRAKKEEIIEDYKIEKYSGSNFKEWLESKYIIFFNQRREQKK